MILTVNMVFGRFLGKESFTVAAVSPELVEQVFREILIPRMRRKPRRMTIGPYYTVDFNKPIPEVA